MKNIFIALFLSVYSAQTFADTVRLRENVDLAMTGTTNISFPLNVEQPTGDATTEVTAGKVYVPMDGPLPTGVTDEVNYFLYAGVGGVTSIFNTTVNTNVINFPLMITVGATDAYLYAAAREGTIDYKVAKRYSASPLKNISNSPVTFPVSPSDICLQTQDCTNFPTTSGTEKSYDIYFFFSASSNLALGSIVTPGTTTTGLYFEVNMSNRVYSKESILPELTEVRRGDARLILNFTATTSILKPKSVRVFRHPGAAPSAEDSLPIGSYDGSLLSEEFPYVNEGEITATGLTNGDLYTVSVLYADLYNFGTVLSNDRPGTPAQIEELLKKNSCFLLTAGFGEDHFIIDYFRHFRDEVLKRSFVGRAFIHTYYKYAPKYALMIYQHESLRALIRGIAYSLYFIFNNYLYVLFGITLIISIFITIRKRLIPEIM